jgi:glycerophosphoryl diester phosphodiesterase
MLRLQRSPGERPYILGHRGAQGVAPENTWAAIRAGMQTGADMLELDVQLSADGDVVVFHDFTLGPKRGDPRWVRELSWAELQTLDVGSWFDPAFAGERIPRLAEVLDWAQDRIPLFLDLKHGFGNQPALDDAVLALLDRGAGEWVVLSSWDHQAMRRVRRLRPDLSTNINLHGRFVGPLAVVRAAQATWVCLWWPDADSALVSRLQAAGLTVVLTGVFDGHYAQAAALGVDVLTASDPAAARAALGGSET